MATPNSRASSTIPTIANVPREQTGNLASDRMQLAGQEALRVLREIVRCPFLFGKMKRLRFTAFQDKIMNHNLGVPAQFMVMGIDHAGGSVQPQLFASPPSAHPLDANNQTRIVSVTNGVFDVWFFPLSQLSEE